MSGRVVCAMCLVLASPNFALGQERRGYVGAGLGNANFKVSSIEPRYINDFEPGRLTSLSAEAGVNVNKRLALGAEVWLPFKRRTITQEYGYIMAATPYRRISNYHERAFLCVLRGRLNSSRRAMAIWTAGGGLIQQNALERYAHLVAGSLTVFGPFGDLQSTSQVKFGFTGGAEVSVETARHLSVVPQFRMLYVPRGNSVYDAADPFGTLGINRVSTRIGVSVRAIF